jgi:hypothetical protein
MPLKCYTKKKNDGGSYTTCNDNIKGNKPKAKAKEKPKSKPKSKPAVSKYAPSLSYVSHKPTKNWMASGTFDPAIQTGWYSFDNPPDWMAGIPYSEPEPQ